MNKAQREHMSRTLKADASLAGKTNYGNTLHGVFMGGDRALMYVVDGTGEVLEVISPHGTGEPINCGDRQGQWDRAVQYARQEGTPFFGVDTDLIVQVLQARKIQK